MTVERLWTALEKIEAQEDLLDWRIGRIAIWPLVRMRIYREVAEAAGIFELLPERPDVIANAGKHVAGRFNYAVVPFLRRNPLGDDPFSKPIADALAADSAASAPLIFGMGEPDANTGRLQVEQLERDFLKRYRLQAKLRVLPTLRASHVAKWQRVVKFLEQEFGVTLKANRAFPRWLLVNFVAQRYGWFRLFRALGIKKLFVVNAWKRALIAGAQQAGVWVVEPQHGLLSQVHPLLSFKNANHVDYLPNELLVWGSYWADIAQLPKSVRTSVIGAPEALVKARALVDQRQPNSVLFVSQAQHTNRLFEIAIRVALANPQLHVTVKPHPQEDREQFDLYLAQNGLTQPGNLHFANRDSAAIALIAQSEYVVGVYSMALMEAVGLGAKAIAVRLPGWENLSKPIARGDITLADPNQDPELKAALAKAQPAADPSYYFAEPVQGKALTDLLKAEPTR